MLMTTQSGSQVGCRWSLADDSRPLHSVSQITGPAEHDAGKHDVLFNKRSCVVVPAGIVDQILRQVKPAAEYRRDGNLYLADMVVSDFSRPDH